MLMRAWNTQIHIYTNASLVERLQEKVKQWRISHVWCEVNSAADVLAKAGILRTDDLIQLNI